MGGYCAANGTARSEPLSTPYAAFVLSTGRCGTQWLAETLAAAAGEGLRVEHEPLDHAWQWRRLLGAGAPEQLPPDLAAPILEHLRRVEQDLPRRSYLEAGHPCWSAIPYLARRFAGRLRVVHLHRHPVPTALSWLTHGAYCRPLLPHLPEKVPLAPTDPGAGLADYAQRWPQLTPFEKCLFYWAQVNRFGLEQERALGVPWLRLGYDELFAADGAGLRRLLAFLDLPQSEAILGARAARVDRHQFITLEQPQPVDAAQHPAIAAVAAAMGYRLDDAAAWNGAARYFPARSG